VRFPRAALERDELYESEYERRLNAALKISGGEKRAAMLLNCNG
jgi:hypothetical protein